VLNRILLEGKIMNGEFVCSYAQGILGGGASL